MNRFGDSGMDTPDIQEAIRLLRDSQPLPVDLTARLLEDGVDVFELIETYGA